MKFAYVAGGGALCCLAGIAILSLHALGVALVLVGAAAVACALRLAYLEGKGE